MSFTRCKVPYKHFLYWFHLILQLSEVCIPSGFTRIHGSWRYLETVGQMPKVSFTCHFTCCERTQWLLCAHHSCFGNHVLGAISIVRYSFKMLLLLIEPLCRSGCVHSSLNVYSTMWSWRWTFVTFQCFCDLDSFFFYMVSISVVCSAYDLNTDSHLALDSIYLRLFKGRESHLLTCKSRNVLTLRMELSCLVFLVS